MAEQSGSKRALLVFVGVCMMMAGGMGLVLNVVGNYFVPLAFAFGLTTPDGGPDVTRVTLLMTVYSYVMLVWLPFSGQLYNKINSRILFGFGGLCVVLGTFLMSIWPNVNLIYISGALWGLGGPMIFLVGPSVLINGWFAPSQAGKFLGIASAFTGVGTFVWSPIFRGFIGNLGYQAAFRIEALIAAILILIPAFFFFTHVSADKAGLKPFGAEKEEAAEQKEVKTQGVSGKFALGTVAFYCIFVMACLISLGGGYKSLMPTAVNSVIDMSNETLVAQVATLGAWMISTAAVGNILGKIALGALSDKIGIRNTMIILSCLNILGFLLMLFLMGYNTVPMLIAGFCIGLADASMSVGLPLVTRTCFGDRCYAKIYSYLNMGIAILGGLGATFVTVVGNAAGFPVAYGVGAVFYAVVIIATIIAIANAKKFRDKWTYEGEPEATRH